MLPSRLIRVIRPESWGGILDGTYAIILTLLTIELPREILVILHHFFDGGDESASAAGFGLNADIGFAIFNLFTGYFAIFVIIYDIWASHRVIVAVDGRLRLRAILTSWTLFLATLVPSLHYVVNTLRQRYVLGGAHFGSLVGHELHFSRALEFPVVALTYFLLYLQASFDLLHLRKVDADVDDKLALAHIAGTALSKCILIMVIYVFFEFASSQIVRWDYLWEAPVLLVLIAMLTYFNVDLFRFCRRR
jgi:hypothetical protein